MRISNNLTVAVAVYLFGLKGRRQNEEQHKIVQQERVLDAGVEEDYWRHHGSSSGRPRRN